MKICTGNMCRINTGRDAFLSQNFQNPLGAIRE